MENNQAIGLLQSLSSGVRLDVFRVLVKRGAEGMGAGEIAAKLDVLPSNFSFHYKALAHAGSLGVEQEGRYQRYRANFDLMLDLIGFLTDECWNGDPTECLTTPAIPVCSAPSSESKHSA